MKTEKTRKKITVLIPCYNEEGGIARVIRGFPREQISKQGFDFEVIVIDNNSKDRTAEVARESGATVIHEPKKGKGNAMRRGFYAIDKDTDYVVMLDGDDSYRPEEILRMVEPLDSNFCDVVIGSRLGGRILDGSMTTFNRTGNWVFSHLVRYFYRVNVTDVLTGYFAWKRESLEHLRPHLKSKGFAIEMEMVTKMAKLGEEIYSVPITYASREGESNLNPITDGFRILWMFTKNFFWNPTKKKVQKIAFVSDSIMPFNNGGKEKRLYEISRRLVKEGREVHVYTMHWWDGPKTIKHEGVIYHALCNLYPLYHGGRRSIKEALIFGFATFKILFVRFDILDVDHMPFFPLFSARVVAWLKGKKLYATWHEVWGKEYWFQYMGGVHGMFGYITEYLSLKLPDVIIANSEHTASRLIQAGVKCEVRTIPLGVDLELIHNTQPAELESDVIFVGRLLKHKNAELLVRAIAEVKKEKRDIRCAIVGYGPEKSRVLSLVSELGLKENIHYMESCENVFGLMKASKVLVLPSVREGFGLVVVEAFASGIPVITTTHKDNAAKDLIKEGVNGFTVPVTEQEVARKILEVLNTCSSMRPQEGIEKYDWNSVVCSLENVWTKEI